MKRLAEEADVSLVTPYNLFASKSGVLYALLSDSLARVDEVVDTKPSSTPVDSVLELAGIAADIYACDAEFYRPLMQFLLGVRDSEHRPRLMVQSLRRWTHTVQAAVRGGLLPATVDQTLLARQLLVTFIGAVELWVHEDLDEKEFRAQSLYGSALLVLANACPTARPRLVKRLRAIERRLPRGLSAWRETDDMRTEKRQTAA